MRPLAVVVSLVGALALLAAGCGGGNDEEASGATDATEWADGFCTALTTWTDSLQRVGEQFQDFSNLSQDSFAEAASDVRSATNTLVDDLKGLGTPDTESGQDAKQAVDDLATDLEDGVAELEVTVEGISGPTDLPGAISSLTSTLTSLSRAAASLFQTLGSADVSGELESAFEDADACDELAS